MLVSIGFPTLQMPSKVRAPQLRASWARAESRLAPNATVVLGSAAISCDALVFEVNIDQLMGPLPVRRTA